MEPRQRLVGTVALVLAGLLAVGTGVAVVAAGRSGDWVLASSGAVLTAAAACQWGAVRARARGGRLLVGEVALLVGLGAVALVLCGVDFVTGERDARAFTVLFAAALVAIVGGVVGTYARSSRPGPDRPS